MKQRITVQAVSLIDGESREVVANVKATTEQAAVDKLFAIAKDEWAYKFLGTGGYLTPSAGTATSIPRTAGTWYSKS